MFKHDFLKGRKYFLTANSESATNLASKSPLGVGDGGLIMLGKLTNIRYRGQPTHSTWVDSKKSEIYPYVIELQITCSRIADVSNNY